MLWVKAFHIVFVASWFAGLFYLPRIFVNLAMVPPESVAERERLLLMARKLLRFTTLLAVPAVGLGLWLWPCRRLREVGPGAVAAAAGATGEPEREQDRDDLGGRDHRSNTSWTSGTPSTHQSYMMVASEPSRVP